MMRRLSARPGVRPMKISENVCLAVSCFCFSTCCLCVLCQKKLRKLICAKEEEEALQTIPAATRMAFSRKGRDAVVIRGITRRSRKSDKKQRKNVASEDEKIAFMKHGHVADARICDDFVKRPKCDYCVVVTRQNCYCASPASTQLSTVFRRPILCGWSTFFNSQYSTFICKRVTVQNIITSDLSCVVIGYSRVSDIGLCDCSPARAVECGSIFENFAVVSEMKGRPLRQAVPDDTPTRRGLILPRGNGFLHEAPAEGIHTPLPFRP